MESKENPIINPPAEGLCPVCEQTTRIRRNGSLYKHPTLGTAVITTITADDDNCTGSGRLPSVVLEMTFARWLHAHRARRDFRTNDITLIAQYAFGERNSCAPLRTPEDVNWTTADGFHAHIHTRPTGHVPEGTSCDWRCRMIEAASAVHQAAYASPGHSETRSAPKQIKE
ncbi:hypothetical protein [Streptacidiphilus sp. EB129]|uniref:hypothetical protein n=1 Tax=Streptacidiphilus sp. EB129 TaxID=3156262 RepID=UPI0035135AAE